MKLLNITIAALLLGGCVYKGAKVTEGTDLAVGLGVPGTEGACQLNILNWLSGFRLAVAENSILVVDYVTAETNDFLFGAVSTRTYKGVKARVEPCEISSGDSTISGDSADR